MGEVKDETPFRYGHAEIRTRVLTEVKAPAGIALRVNETYKPLTTSRNGLQRWGGVTRFISLHDNLYETINYIPVDLFFKGE